MLNISPTEATAPGHITASPTGQPRPLASNLNIDYTGQTVPNLVTVPVGTNGRIDLDTQSGTHLIADITGWFELFVNDADRVNLLVVAAEQTNLLATPGDGSVVRQFAAGATLRRIGMMLSIEPGTQPERALYGRVTAVAGVTPAGLGDVVPTGGFQLTVPGAMSPSFGARLEYGSGEVYAHLEVITPVNPCPEWWSKGLKVVFTWDSGRKLDIDLDDAELFTENFVLRSDQGWPGVPSNATAAGDGTNPVRPSRRVGWLLVKGSAPPPVTTGRFESSASCPSRPRHGYSTGGNATTTVRPASC